MKGKVNTMDATFDATTFDDIDEDFHPILQWLLEHPIEIVNDSLAEPWNEEEPFVCTITSSWVEWVDEDD